MEKELKVTVMQEIEDGYIISQELTCKDESKVRYSVYNLVDQPEDAIIDRDLFSATNYIEALNLGIELAKKGYNKVVADYPTGNDTK